METQPYIPPAPPEPKKRIWPKIVLGVIVLYVVGTILQQVAEQDTYVPDSTSIDSNDSLQTDTQLEIMRLVWDTEITATDRANICDYYNTPPVGTTPEMVEIFAEGADMTYAEAEPLLNQLLAEKC